MHDKRVTAGDTGSASESVVEALGEDTLEGIGEPSSSYDPTSGSNFGIVLMLDIAYAASVGSLGTVIGTPPNAMLAAYTVEQGINIGFGQWMLPGVLMAVMLMFRAWSLLTNALSKSKITYIPGGHELICEELKRFSRVSAGERRVLMVFIAVALT